jgi:PAS domain S-box-containing protein
VVIEINKPSPTSAKEPHHPAKKITPKNGEPPLSRDETELRRLVQELKIHQIELEMQNEELRRVQAELELSRDKLAQLYDFAPVGYLCLDANGLIRGANHAGAKLFGLDKQRLVNQPFIRLIADSTGKEVFAKHLKNVLQQQAVVRCEIRLSGKQGNLIYGQLQSSVVNGGTPEETILTSIVDNTQSRTLTEQLQTAHDTLEDIVAARTKELRQTNQQLSQEIEERKQAETELKDAINQVNQLTKRLQSENIQLHQELTRSDNFGEIIGQSPAISYVFYRVDQVAPQDTTVLLLGETGTGKGMVARETHLRSSRKDRSMVTVNCTALPANLIESELFGREKGAFTGAHARQMGRFELADGGTLFLDEIGEMPLELQVKLLRVIQDGEFERLGSPRTIKVNVRIIAASNRNLEEEIKTGRFREDLFYRLSVFPITIPPLRQRLEDIPLLVRYFVAKFNKKTGKRVESISQATLAALQKYNWPGNVRELESVIERAIITSKGTALQVLDRFEIFREHGERDTQDFKALADLERDHILQVLQKTGWRVEGEKGAALLLGLNPSTLRARMRKYDIRRQ